MAQTSPPAGAGQTEEPDRYTQVVTVIITTEIDNENATSDEEFEANERAAAKEHKFFIHMADICKQSRFFKAAFNGGLVEGLTQTLTLDDVGPRIFKYVVNWVYSGFLGGRVRAPNDEVFFEYVLADLAELWVLGQPFLIPRFQNKIIDKISQRYLPQSYTQSEFSGLLRILGKLEEETEVLRYWAVNYLCFRNEGPFNTCG